MAGPKTPFDVLKEEYVALRSEIVQSITFQHRILVAGYGASGAVIGILASKSQLSWVGLMVVPFIFVAMIAIWIVECNRMVRAGYYIGDVLWPELCASVGYAGDADWERWIRNVEGISGTFGDTQDRQQQLAVWVVPAVISLFCVGSSVWRLRGGGAAIYTLIGLVVGVSVVLWVNLVLRLQVVSRLGNVKLRAPF